jgi:HD-GYP domain-containing protein (c-di-GMP phosphodiesterase class II)
VSTPPPSATTGSALKSGTARGAAPTPSAKSAAPAKPGDARQRTGEFAIPIKDSRQSTGQFDARTLAGKRDARNPASSNDPSSDNNVRGLWGKMRAGVSGLFAKRDDDDVVDESPVEFVPEKTTQTRAQFIPETVQLTIYEDAKPVEEEIGAASAAFQRTTDMLRRVAEDIRAGNNLKLESVEEVIDDMVESMVRNPDALMWVGRMRERSAGIYDHGLSVAICLVAFGRHLGYPKEALSHLGMMGLLLDIGKIKLPRELLERDARLSSDEFEQIKEHVDLGLEILAETPNLHPDILDGVAQHHERMNGTGYPNNMMGDKISVFGRMSAIADTFSAITKHRPYAEAVSPHQALQMLSNWSGTQFHAEMVEQFIQSIGVFPVGSLVELSTGEVAVVVTHGKLKRLKPKVLVVTEADKTHCKHPALRDLLYDISDNPAHIRRGLPSNSYGIDPSEYYLA